MRCVAVVGIVLGLAGCGGRDGSQSAALESCERPCSYDVEACSTAALEDFPPLAETREDWEAECTGLGLWYGTCDGGNQVLGYSSGQTGEFRVYNKRGEFLSLVGFIDSGGPCHGQNYWPMLPKCDGATVTETICGVDRTGEPMVIWWVPPS